MRFYLANWLGLMTDCPTPYTKDEVLDMMSRPYWPKSNWFFVSEAQTIVTNIRREMSHFPFEIKTKDDLQEALIKFNGMREVRFV